MSKAICTFTLAIHEDGVDIDRVGPTSVNLVDEAEVVAVCVRAMQHYLSSITRKLSPEDRGEVMEAFVKSINSGQKADDE